MRSDPTDNGGLFIGRRPGTKPVHYRDTPEKGTAKGQRRDSIVAGLLLALMIFCALLFWGPIPVAWLWLVSHVPYFADNSFTGLTVAFFGILATYMAALVAMKHLDRAWILVRRASGVDQRDGVIGRVFAYTAVVGVTLFSIWLILLGGLADSVKNNAG